MAKELSKEEYIKLFEMFCGDDSVRPWMNTPFKQNDHHIATDGHGMILLPCKYRELDFLALENPANIMSVVPTEKACDIRISVAKLEQALVPEMIEEEAWIGKDVECKECDGEGCVDWEYKHYTDSFKCPECFGDGLEEKRRKEKTGKQVPNPRKGFRVFGGIGFYDKQLRRLIDASKIIGEETIVRTFGTEDGPNAFEVGEFKILVMPFKIQAWQLTETTEIKNEDIEPNIVSA